MLIYLPVCKLLLLGVAMEWPVAERRGRGLCVAVQRVDSGHVKWRLSLCDGTKQLAERDGRVLTRPPLVLLMS